MTDFVDLTHLRELTDGDREMEEQLFDIFITSSEDCIDLLETLSGDDAKLEWKKSAHSLKGAALNIGANNLAQICIKAQESFETSQETKKAILQELKTSFASTKSFLENL